MTTRYLIILMSLPVIVAEKKVEIKEPMSKAFRAALAEKDEAQFIVRLLALGHSERQNPEIIKKGMSLLSPSASKSFNDVICDGHIYKLVLAMVATDYTDKNVHFKAYNITDESLNVMQVGINRNSITCQALGKV